MFADIFHPHLRQKEKTRESKNNNTTTTTTPSNALNFIAGIMCQPCFCSMNTAYIILLKIDWIFSRIFSIIDEYRNFHMPTKLNCCGRCSVVVYV